MEETKARGIYYSIAMGVPLRRKRFTAAKKNSKNKSSLGLCRIEGRKHQMKTRGFTMAKNCGLEHEHSQL